jgi:hypothetical protein
MFLGIGVAGVGFEHLISLQSGQQLTGTEGWVLCSAVALLMGALITIGATSEVAHRHGSGNGYLWAQYALTAVALLLGAFAPHLHRVLFVLGVLAACCGQTLLGRIEITVPKLVSRKA